MSLPEKLTVVTANTQYNAIDPENPALQAAFEGAHLLLLQEVVNPAAENLEDRLDGLGFSLLAVNPNYGLAIAGSNQDGLEMVSDSFQEYSLGKMSRSEKRLSEKSAGRPHGFGERGVISIDISTPHGPVTIANTHPTVPVRPRARSQQIRELGGWITGEVRDNPLIVGGDMNHWQGPKACDKKMRIASELLAVKLSEPTWYAEGSQEERLLRLAARLRRVPLSDFDGHHDTILYSRHLRPRDAKVIKIPSDHAAVRVEFLV